VLYWLIKAILTPILRVFYRVRIDGRDHVPTQGPVILAANHRSFMDSLFLPLVIRRRVTFVAKAEYFDDKKTAWFFRGVGQIPIRREGGSASERAADLAKPTVLVSGFGGREAYRIASIENFEFDFWYGQISASASDAFTMLSLFSFWPL